MAALRTFVFAALVVGTSAIARAQPAPAPGASAGSAAPPEPTGTFQVGAGYRSGDGFLANASIAQSDLFHTGTALSLDGALSQRTSHFAASFVDPKLDHGRLALSADLYTDRRLLGDTGIWRQAAGADLQLTAHLAPYAQAFVGYRFEAVASTGRLASLRTGISYNSLDAPVLPTRGSSAGVTLALADRAFGASYDLMRIDAWANTHRAVGPFVFHTGGRVAAIGGTSRLGAVPATELLYFDGPADVRGLGYGAGPGALGGANLLATWRTELELPIAHGFAIHAFWDVGAAATWSGSYALGQSVGGGIVWRSRIGAISIDYAVPLGGGKPALMFNIGGSF